MEKMPQNQEVYRKFGLTMAGVFALIFGLSLPLALGRDLPLWPYIPAAFFLSAALLQPMRLRLIYLGWMKIGHVLAGVNSKILLCLVFLVMFTPIALVFKMLGKDPLHRRFRAGETTSYWQKSSRQHKKHMEKVY